MSKKRRKSDKTGRSVESQYANLTFDFIKSEAFRQLPGSALKVFMELRARYNGSNNGRICLSLDECTRLLRMGKGTAKMAFETLVEMGFARLRKRGRWLGRKASEWELTCLPCDGHPATNQWKQWKSENPLREAKKVALRYQSGFVECFEGSDTVPKH